MYDVESLGDDKDDKIDLLPPIYSRDVQQPQAHIKLLSDLYFIIEIFLQQKLILKRLAQWH